MPNTLTSFHTMQEFKKARSTIINTDYAAFLGIRIPINSDTGSASTNEHNLGTTEYRFLTSYCQDLDIRSATTSVSIILSGNDTATLGSYDFKIGGNTVTSLGPDGFPSWSFVPRGVTTVASTFGQLIISSDIASSTLLASADVFTTIGASLTIKTKGGPIEIGFINGTASTPTTSAQSYLDWGSRVTTTGGSSNWTSNMRLEVNGSAVLNSQIILDTSNGITGTGIAYDRDTRFLPGMFRFIYSPAAGTHSITVALSCNTDGCYWHLNNVRLYAYEL